MPACRFCQTPYQGDARFCPACGRRLDSTPTAAGSADPQSGRLFGNKYRAVRIVGEGGMGVVYEGVQINVDQRVAIKILHARFAGRPDLVQRFENEARACARLHDPHIVTLHDFGREDDGTFYLVMEFVAGPSLAEFIDKQGPLPEDLAVDLTVQLSEALSTAHAAGVVHRDLKPNNVILLRSASGRHFVKLLDFGIARVPDGSGGPLTATGDVFGTPEYMSPEQCRGERADERTDVYATGVILYHMLTGALPYQATTPISLVMAKVNNPPERPEARRPDLSPWLVNIVMRAIEREPAARYASMGEFRDDLERWRGSSATGRLVPSRPPVPASGTPAAGAAQAAAAPAERLATAPTLARPVSLPAETTLSRARRGRAGLFVGVALGVAVAAAVLLFALRGGSDAPGPSPAGAALPAGAHGGPRPDTASAPVAASDAGGPRDAGVPHDVAAVTPPAPDAAAVPHPDAGRDAGTPPADPQAERAAAEAAFARADFATARHLCEGVLARGPDPACAALLARTNDWLAAVAALAKSPPCAEVRRLIRQAETLHPAAAGALRESHKRCFATRGGGGVVPPREL